MSKRKNKESNEYKLPALFHLLHQHHPFASLLFVFVTFCLWHFVFSWTNKTPSTYCMPRLFSIDIVMNYTQGSCVKSLESSDRKRIWTDGWSNDPTTINHTVMDRYIKHSHHATHFFLFVLATYAPWL